MKRKAVRNDKRTKRLKNRLVFQRVMVHIGRCFSNVMYDITSFVLTSMHNYKQLLTKKLFQVGDTKKGVEVFEIVYDNEDSAVDNNNLLKVNETYFVYLFSKYPYIHIDGKNYAVELGETHSLDLDGDMIKIISVTPNTLPIATTYPRMQIFTVNVGDEIIT